MLNITAAPATIYRDHKAPVGTARAKCETIAAGLNADDSGDWLYRVVRVPEDGFVIEVSETISGHVLGRL